MDGQTTSMSELQMLQINAQKTTSPPSPAGTLESSSNLRHWHLTHVNRKTHTSEEGNSSVFIFKDDSSLFLPDMFPYSVGLWVL